MNIISIPSPNKEIGRKGYTISGVVIHIADGSTQSVIAEFSSPKTQKSSHYHVSRDGSIIQFVNEEDTAFAQGRVYKPTSAMIMARADLNPNIYLISIEHEDYEGGVNLKDITDAQYRSTASVLYNISQRWMFPLNRQHVIGHREVNALKTCPENINMNRLIELANAEPERRRALTTLIAQISSLMATIGRFFKGRSPS